MSGPVRVQLRRTKGWRMPENTVVVTRGRGKKWGNPFAIGDFGIPDAASAVQRFREWLDGRVVGPPPPSAGEVQAALRGKNLACFCPRHSPCHADVLLEIANRPAILAEGAPE